MYWSPATRLPLKANIMPLQRFENLKNFFHMNNNLKMPKHGEYNFDHLYKDHHLIAYWNVTEILNKKKLML